MNIVVNNNTEILIALELKERIFLDTNSLQSRNKVVSVSISTMRKIRMKILPYRAKFVDYFEIFRAPPELDFS